MNGKIEMQNMKEKAWTVCKEFLGGPWKEAALEEFRFFKVRGGLSNSLYRCILPENITAESSKVPRDVLYRIYGPIQEDTEHLVSEAVTFLLLSERELGPKLYGLFLKGRLEEFIPSHSLSTAEMRKYSLLTAREMAKIHALDVPVRKVPHLFEKYGKSWVNEAKDFLKKDDEYFICFDEYLEEIEWLQQEMKNSNSPVVYCHNDLQGGNILLCEGTTQNHNGEPKVIPIDFEFASYNYRGYDIANHFIEWCITYNTPDYPHFKLDMNDFPSKEEQAEFFAAYLDQLVKEGIQLRRPLKDEVESMAKELTLFICAPQLMASIWSAYSIITSSITFGHKEHGKTRLQLYWKFKEEYLKSK